MPCTSRQLPIIQVKRRKYLPSNWSFKAFSLLQPEPSELCTLIFYCPAHLPVKNCVMKNINFSTVCFLSILLIACKQEEVEPTRETGSLHIDIGLHVQVNEVNSLFKSAQQTEDFKVTLFRGDGSVALAFDNLLSMPDTIELETGVYYIEAHSDNDLPAAFENPYYYGISEDFTIGNNQHQSVLVTCRLANTMVSVVYSANIISNFSDYTTTVSSALGSLVFPKDETRMGYFRTLPLDITVQLAYLKPDGTGGSKMLTGSIPEPLPNRHYEILVDASIDEGMASFQVLLDSSEVLVEVIQINDDPENPLPGTLGFGDILITEIMYDPSALSDTEGEWFEIYNNSGQTINLQNLILGRDDLNRHTVTDPIDLLPGAFFVFKRTVMASNALNGYVYGSDITLSNTGAVLSIFNKGTETVPGPVIFSVDYGLVGFPDGAGASISLGPDRINAADALLGSSWCAATSVYNTGDLGTPGISNDPCQ
jgi:hypothetical protein